MPVKLVKLVDSPVQFNFGGPNPKGEYDNTATYAVGDSVSYNGSSYIAIQQTTGNLPTDETFWQILAEKGDTGPQGPQGTPGVAAEDFRQNFTISNWIGPSSGFYTINFLHNLNNATIEVEVWEASYPVDVERIIVDNNNVTLRVPSDPDLRFNGFLWIKQN